MLAKLVVAVAALLFSLASPVMSDVPADLISQIPGYGPTKTKQYSGYLPVDAEGSVMLHYWLVTSPNAKSDPLTIWMNGGPGCSSLGGALFELGPYTFTGELDPTTNIPKIVDNKYAWSTASSVLFIEHPAGVGFSYAKNATTVSDDYIQSQNTHGFMVNFFKAYPEFATNDFFISGESYAGIYVPTLAGRIVESNTAGTTKINLKGILVGNGCWGSDVGTCSSSPDRDRIELSLYHGHSMISENVWQQLLKVCGEGFNSTDHQCATLKSAAVRSKGRTDVYNVYDTCGNDLLTPAAESLRAPSLSGERLGDAVTCLDSNLAVQFLDAPAVREAFHVEHSTRKSWADCSRIQYTSNHPDERPLYRVLVENMRVLIFNGDADACVPWVGNEEWTRSMEYPVSDAWRPWTAAAEGRQWTGGFIVSYGPNFSFLTIKHAGHLVPQYEPEAALTFYTRFISNSRI